MPDKPKTHKPPHQQTRAQQDKQRPDASERGYTAAWRKLRKAFALENPLCVKCLAQGVITNTEVVHHIQPIGDAPHLALEWSNLEATCNTHHQEYHANDGTRIWNKKDSK